MTLIERITTTDVAQSERLDYWNRIASETYSGLLVDAERDAFNADMRRWTLGEVTMMRPRSPAAVVHRWKDRSQKDSNRVVVHLVHSGNCIQSQGKDSCGLRAGDLVVVDSDQPYRIAVPNGHEMLVAELPRDALVARVPDPDAKLVKRFEGATPGCRLLHDFLLSLWRHGDQSASDPDWLDGVVNVFYDLLALAIVHAEAPPAEGSDLRRKLRDLIAAQLSDPLLGTNSLAAELGVTMRTVQNVFAAMGVTPSAYILERRLERAAERLRVGSTQSVTAIAFDLGFNDSTYFARCFRQKYGVAPSVYRVRH